MVKIYFCAIRSILSEKRIQFLNELKMNSFKYYVLIKLSKVLKQ